MEGENLPKPFLSTLSDAAEEVVRHEYVRVLTHYDADGLASAGIIANALRRRGISFHLSFSKTLDPEMINKVGKRAECLLLADMGSSFIPHLEKLEAKVVVLDHHVTTSLSNKVIHVNPHLFGIDGMTSACAAAVCMMFALAVDQKNWDLLPIAFAGMVGDRQHIRGMSGVNRYLLEGGLSRKILELRRGSLVPEGKLADSLADGYEPYIIGVTGSVQGAMALLREAGLAEDASWAQLNDAERRKLSSLIALRLLSQGCSTSAMEELITDRYYFPSWGTTADDLAQLLNACGRTDQEGVGVAMALGDVGARKVAESLRNEYRMAVIEGMRKVVEGGIRKMDSLQWFESPNPSLSGVLCGLTMQFLGDCTRPTVALSFHGEKTRVSSRATYKLLEKGIDLSVAMSKAAAAVGGLGGGHAIASGATIPRGREEEFLTNLDEIIKEQKRSKMVEQRPSAP
ncbi:MAG: DHH family phosphoesterase [Methanomassiliicoccales archaeon]